MMKYMICAAKEISEQTTQHAQKHILKFFLALYFSPPGLLFILIHASTCAGHTTSKNDKIYISFNPTRPTAVVLVVECLKVLRKASVQVHRVSLHPVFKLGK